MKLKSGIEIPIVLATSIDSPSEALKWRWRCCTHLRESSFFVPDFFWKVSDVECQIIGGAFRATWCFCSINFAISIHSVGVPNRQTWLAHGLTKMWLLYFLTKSSMFGVSWAFLSGFFLTFLVIFGSVWHFLASLGQELPDHRFLAIYIAIFKIESTFKLFEETSSLRLPRNTPFWRPLLRIPVYVARAS